MDSKDAFWNSQIKAKVDQESLYAILLVCGANFIAMVSFAFHITFWKEYPILSGFICFLYLSTVFGCAYDNKSQLLSTGMKRLKDWSRYSESTSTYFYFAPYISNEDFIYLSDDRHKCEYLRFTIDKYKITLSNIENRDIVYSCQRNSRENIDDSLIELERKLKADGKTITRIYNKFGDIKWQHGVFNTSPSKIRKCIYIFSTFIWLFVEYAVTLAPAYCIYKYLN